MKNAVFNNYIVCPSGQSDGNVERDLLQEHSNFWLKHVFNGRLTKFNSSFMCKAIVLNIVPLKELAQTILQKFRLSDMSSSHSQTDITANINHLGHSLLAYRQHLYWPGCTQSYIVADRIDCGSSKLEAGVIERFLNKYFRK